MRYPLTLPPGLFGDDTTYSSKGRWASGDMVRFRLGKPEVDGGWERLMSQQLTGTCRAVFPWTDNDGVLDIAFGTNEKLQLWRGGELFDITPASGFTAGAVHGTGSSGFGTGAFGSGPFGQTSPTSSYYPLTWSFGAWGENLLASPRGQTMFVWANNTAAAASSISAAPDNITQMLVAPLNGGYQAFALGCNEELSGDFNPMCIRHCSIRNYNQWSTTASGSTAREYILTGGGQIIGGRMCGPYILVWTNDSIFLGVFQGSLLLPWKFDRVARNCGLLGPNAVVVVGQTAYWMTPDLQFMRYAVGGQPEPVVCPIHREVIENMTASQGEKVVASSNSKFSEIRFDYPDRRDGYENSRFVRLCINGPDAGAWSAGTQAARTAMVDAGPQLFPIGVDPTGRVYYHERGTSADGAALPWRIRTAGQYVNPDSRLLIREVWLDFAGQVGPAAVTVYARETPQGDTVSVSAPGLAPGDQKADLLISGRIFEIEFSGGSPPPTSCRIGAPTFEASPAGGL